MGRRSIYSSSRPRLEAGVRPPEEAGATARGAAGGSPARSPAGGPGDPRGADKPRDTEARRGRLPSLLTFLRKRQRLFLPLLGAGLLALALLLTGFLAPEEGALTREELETAILETLENRPAERSRAATAHEIIAPSVVRVSRLGAMEENEATDGDEVLGVGTGVVIDERGLVLTSLHVVAGAGRLGIRFVDGFETEATVVSRDPANDLAVLQVDVVPEGVPAAAIVSTDGLALGDEVVAVGHPFGIGPSVSYGVISGLNRQYANPEGELVFDNLIQFDAAANPGNSGGPLVNRNGEVLGIVSSIYNPTEQRVFIGIGFAVPIETAAAAAGESPF